MRRARFAALAVLGYGLLAAGASAQTIPQVPAPSLISPTLSVGVPILFQWTPVNPGNVYNFFLQSRARTAAAPGPLVVSYELQISDAPDVTSHVLVDLTTSTTIFTFANQNLPGSGFTNLQAPGLPLSGGLYYWRVRALINTTATAYSNIGRFTLNIGTGGGESTPFHDMQITSLVLTTPAYVGAATVVVATVQNTGTFPEQNAPLTITANGLQLAHVNVPPTGAGQSSRITAIWTPTQRGLAQITSILNFNGQNPQRKLATISPLVAEVPQYITAMTGTLRLGEQGYFLADSRGREISLVLVAPGTQLDLGPLLGKNIVLRGTLSKRQTSFVLTANQVALSP
jgi:hypothetical protein